MLSYYRQLLPEGSGAILFHFTWVGVTDLDRMNLDPAQFNLFNAALPAYTFPIGLHLALVGSPVSAELILPEFIVKPSAFFNPEPFFPRAWYRKQLVNLRQSLPDGRVFIVPTGQLGTAGFVADLDEIQVFEQDNVYAEM